MFLDSYRSNIRTLTGSDSTDLPDTVCDLFISEAWRHCAYWKPNWPFYRKSWTYSLAGTGSLSTITSKQLIAGADSTAENAPPAAPNSIESIFDTTDDTKLRFVDLIEFDRLFQENDTQTGDPRCYTVEQGEWKSESLDTGWTSTFTIKVWPIPTNAKTYSLKINGYREPIDFVARAHGASAASLGGYYNATASSASPDMPEAFHEAILWYAIGQAFAYLDEGDRTTYYNAKCDNVLAMQEGIWFRASSHEPIIKNGGRRTGVYNRLPTRLRYSFE